MSESESCRFSSISMRVQFIRWNGGAIGCISLEHLWCGFALQSHLFISHVLSVRTNPEKVSAGPVLLRLHIPDILHQSPFLLIWLLGFIFQDVFSQAVEPRSLYFCFCCDASSHFWKFSCFPPHSFNNVVFLFTCLWVFGVPCELYSLAQTGVWRKCRPGNPSNLQLMCGSLSLCDYYNCCLVEQWAISWVLSPPISITL